MLLKIDLHVHTDRSPDGCSSIREIAAVAKKRGLHGLAITDHDLILNESDSQRLSGELGIMVIPGVELTTTAGHLIILNPKRRFNGLSLEGAVKTAHQEGSTVIIPHPMDPLSHGIGISEARSLIPYSPLIETLNASTLSYYNSKATSFALRNSLPMVAGSDAHLADAVGDAYTVVDSPSSDPASVILSISAGKTMPRGKRTSAVTLAKTVCTRLIRRVRC
ncbi:MAG: PHP domain-containing protein [Candidatus Methanosuratus sp.]|nr:PHP domain-containing protein [Candidatus Methanosuratincola sp.]